MSESKAKAYGVAKAPGLAAQLELFGARLSPDAIDYLADYLGIVYLDGRLDELARPTADIERLRETDEGRYGVVGLFRSRGAA